MQSSKLGIQDIPEEILCDFFAEAVEQDVQSHPGSTAQALSQTCQQWRNIALSLEGLWGKIQINDETHLGNWITWLERAGKRALRWSVRVGRGNNHVQDKYTAFLAALVKKQHQWKEVEIAYRAIPYGDEKLAFLLDNLAGLETFSVKHEMPFITANGYEDFFDWSGFEMFQPLFIVPDNGKPIGDKLTTFTCEFNESNYLTREGLLSFLYDCRNLIKVTIIHGREIYNDGDLPDEATERGFDEDLPVDLDSVQHFVYQSVGAEGSLLLHIGLPNLRSLEVRSDIWRGYVMLDANRSSIVSCLESWDAPIEWASFEGGPLLDHGRLLETLPQIKALSFVSETTAPLQALCPLAGRESLCPQLQRLKFTCCDVVGTEQLRQLAYVRGENFRADVRSTKWNAAQIEMLKINLAEEIANGKCQVSVASAHEDLENERRSWYKETEDVVSNHPPPMAK